MLRLGLDIGTNSIGWWLYEIANGQPIAVIDAGARIFSDGRDAKTGASLAVDRRNARAMRRGRDRYLQRRAMLIKRLAASGLMPQDPDQAKALELLDPFALRAKGLDQALPLAHLGRALFHIDQRRGFKSNRKTDGGDNEGGKIKDATGRLEMAMGAAGARTYGEFLHKRRAAATDPRQTPAVRTRLSLRLDEASGKSEPGYDFYPDRRHLEEEFHKLWRAQEPHHPAMTDELRDQLFETIFYQRLLKEPKVGRCLFYPEDRLPRAHPLTQARVLYETVNNLRISANGRASRSLTLEQRDQVITLLNGKEPLKSPGGTKLTLDALAKALKLGGEKFTLETAARDAIACDPVRASLAFKDRFGARWSTLDWQQQWGLIQRRQNAQSDQQVQELIQWLIDSHHLTPAQARATADAPLPEGYSRLGLTATKAILDKLRSDVLTYDKAATAIGRHHSDGRSGEVLPDLPYYGKVLDRHVIPGSQDPAHDDITRYGRITNPTVHIGLNQLRRLINKIIEVHGKPNEIVVELARELKQSIDQKAEAERTIKKNTDAAIRRGADLGELGQADNGANRAVLRMWEEMNSDPMKRFCPYTGKLISAGMLFTGECDIDHILPYSRTLDDSGSNKTLCMKEANRSKRNKSPSEAGHDGMHIWALEGENLKHLPGNKAWRFAPDAMAKFEGERDFLARALVDTQYLSRIAREYLDKLYDGEDGKSHVWVVPGRLTEMLRRHWGLNSLLHDDQRDVNKAKNRMDHRHHALDAAVIGATDRSLIKRMADQSQIDAGRGLDDLASRVLPPFEGFRDAIKARINSMTVSHRADHGSIDASARAKGADSTTGQLHNDTAYGLTGQSLNGVPLVVTRKPFDGLTPAIIEKLRDAPLAEALRLATKGKDGKDFQTALRTFAARPGPYQGIRRVRVIEPVDVIEIKDRNGVAYKGYKGDSNQRYEIWRMPDGAYKHVVISTFDAHKEMDHRPHPAAKRLLKLHKNDMVRLENSKFGPTCVTVERFNVNGQVSMVAHNQGNADQRYRKDKEDIYIRMQAASLIKSGARRVMVDEMGRVKDPGPAKVA
ncbi:MAG: type RNA-guided endonuclease Cas9 [Cypionkella sp.]|uniref:type II CRISPR RNA-guided endonuclease Cas9 n=1 Tax=Cypionkella sp. TaxID=2811411 RepID=UPI002609CBA4|nr:type II CRISPR RNA-guided endonuclease Cas9 [Cypionkella sp.]MDB5658473.1 type RNA-guided endonuclease Cas9 [Cypionkella sp.]